ncbi:MAG: PIN domain-containing protein [Candidatus Woesearchaeota archaeon]
MPRRFYLDTCIWRDHFEDRTGPGGRPLGKYATQLLMKIIRDKDIIIISDAIIAELKKGFYDDEISDILNVLQAMGSVENIPIQDIDDTEAKMISKERKLPILDVLHAILARNNQAILVTQDKHFMQLSDIVNCKRPEELL